MAGPVLCLGYSNPTKSLEQLARALVDVDGLQVWQSETVDPSQELPFFSMLPDREKGLQIAERLRASFATPSVLSLLLQSCPRKWRLGFAGSCLSRTSETCGTIGSRPDVGAAVGYWQHSALLAVLFLEPTGEQVTTV